MRTSCMKAGRARHEFSSAPSGLPTVEVTHTHGLRRGLMVVTSALIVAFGAVLTLGSSAAAQTVAIREVGIQGYFTNDGSPTRVRVEISNPGPATSLKLTLSVSDKDARLGRVDKYAFGVPLRAGEDRVLDLPIPLFAAQPVLTINATAPDGRVVTSLTRPLQRIGSNRLVLLLCAEDKTCNDVLGAIQGSGSDELKTRKTQQYTFLVLKDLPDEWWAYGPAHSIIVARPAASLSPPQRAALEGYCRQRGQLALIEPLVGAGLMDAYRTGPDSESRVETGSGWLYRFRDAEALAAFLDRSLSEFPTTDIAKFYGQYTRSTWIRSGFPGSPLATVFDFPTWGWLIFWLVLYIVIVGGVNFYVLSKVKRRELAWITVPGIALLFALMLYVTSAAKRPDRVGLDEIATYRLDDLTPQAAATYQLRVSSPIRQDLTLTVPGDALWSGTDQQLTPAATFSVFDRRAENFGTGWSIRVMPTMEFSIPLLQWSYQDLNLSGLATLPGSLRRLGNGQLVNETGFSFRQAVFREDDRVYDLGAVGAGAAFLPRNGAGEETQRLVGPSEFAIAAAGRRFNRESHEDIKRMLAGETSTTKRTFAGLAEAASLGSSLGTKDTTVRRYVIVVITVRNTP